MAKRKSALKNQRTSAIGSVASAKQSVPKELNQYLTTKKAAELLGVDRTQAARLVREGKIKGIKLGHDWLVYSPSLREYHRTKPAGGRPPSRIPRIG